MRNLWRMTVLLSLIFITINSHAQIENVKEGLKSISVVNARMAKAFSALTTLQDSTIYTSGSFSDPNYDPLASPAFFSELSDAIIEASQEGNGPVVRQALGISL